MRQVVGRDHRPEAVALVGGSGDDFDGFDERCNLAEAETGTEAAWGVDMVPEEVGGRTVSAVERCGPVACSSAVVQTGFEA